MLKRTKGRFLLTMLVITGLAGTLKNSSLTTAERKFAINDLKETKAALLKSIKGLSDAQLNFKPSPERWSIKECVFHIAMAEKGFWRMLDASMKEPVISGQPHAARISDEEVVKIVTDRSKKLRAPASLEPSKAPWKDVTEALTGFKAIRADHIKYAKSTTEDLRDHFIPMAPGKLDGYQLILFMSAHCGRHIQQINEIKADPAFPEK